MPCYTVLEWNSLPYGEGAGCIPHRHADRLAAVARRSVHAGRGGMGVLDHGRHALRARSIVGVVAAGDVSLEILPKIAPEDDDPSDADKAQIRKRLVHMLVAALDLTLDPGEAARLDWQSHSVLDLLIRIFCDRLTEALRRGMPRRYVACEDDLTVMRGRLDLVRQYTRHAANPARLACRYDRLSEDMIINHIMKAAIRHLMRHASHPSVQQRLRELSFLYADIADCPASLIRWDLVVLDRTNRAWKDLLAMAKLFLQKRYQTTTQGESDGLALLFDMNALFEEYVARQLVRAVAGTGLKVSRQGGRRHCLTDLANGRQHFQTRPDILVHRSGQVVKIIDTKWKRIAPRIDDPRMGVSQADIYQMMAYAHVYEAERLQLLYPHHVGLRATDGILGSYLVNGHGGVLEIATIDLARPRDITDRLRRLVVPDETGLRE